jgi:hypothetical protein
VNRAELVLGDSVGAPEVVRLDLLGRFVVAHTVTRFIGVRSGSGRPGVRSAAIFDYRRWRGILYGRCPLL